MPHLQGWIESISQAVDGQAGEMVVIVQLGADDTFDAAQGGVGLVQAAYQRGGAGSASRRGSHGARVASQEEARPASARDLSRVDDLPRHRLASSEHVRNERVRCFDSSEMLRWLARGVSRPAVGSGRRSQP
jgi:hypothetical protein